MSFARTMAVALGLLAAGCASDARLSGPRVINVEADATPAAKVLASNMQSLVDATSPSYVTLIVSQRQGRTRLERDSLPDAVTSGSGFVIDNAGHVLTAAHVAVAKGYTVDARAADGRLYQGKVIAIRPDNDMALIRLSGFSGRPVQVAASPCLRPSEPVFSLGKPHARGDTARIGASEAMSYGKAVRYQGYGYPDAMVLRMSTKKGESGGPVFNARAQLVGMVVSTLSDGGGRPLNLAHAIPLPTLARFACANSKCSKAWRAEANRAVRECPVAPARSG